MTNLSQLFLRTFFRYGLRPTFLFIPPFHSSRHSSFPSTVPRALRQWRAHEVKQRWHIACARSLLPGWGTNGVGITQRSDGGRKYTFISVLHITKKNVCFCAYPRHLLLSRGFIRAIYETQRFSFAPLAGLKISVREDNHSPPINNKIRNCGVVPPNHHTSLCPINA